MHYLKFSIKRQVVYEKVPPAGAQKKTIQYIQSTVVYEGKEIINEIDRPLLEYSD